ncbi:hypothetical protein [Flavobacterium sp. Root186]|uniref:hypothetical protein n=1 Tax=Flavobacterium sp. Root186 TaxID=1736485 RepID=UPI0006F4048A|nr:hypothetical protein [Flavobacterium sp. Root186]KRB54746.1 hypothetical protein ASD98_17045 [Flavobacterium sp. Root186]
MSNITPINIVTSPTEYFESQKKNLETRLQEIELTEEEKEKIISEKTIKTIRDKTLGMFKIGEAINTFLNWNEEIDSELKNAKKEYLLNSYFDKTEQSENSIKQIQQFLTSPQGNTLFNKIIRILDNTPPDIELTDHLANVLKNITNSDFIKLFDDHKFALNQIELLTPQALTLLSDHKSWPAWNLESYGSQGGRITSNWMPDFISGYSSTKNITDPNLILKITHSMNDLVKNNYAYANLTNQSLVAAVFITDIAKIILKYIQ